MPLTGGQALKITTSRYFTPSGVSINGVGIVPDTVLEGTEQPPADMDLVDRDPQVLLALQALSGHPGQIARGADAAPSDAQ
jgi:carboxyl-terminal processing protease